MNTYIILFPETFDDANSFVDMIDQFPDWVRLVPHHVWQIASYDNKSTDVRAKIIEKMNAHQQSIPFIVINVTKSGWASHKIDKDIIGWLNKDR